MCLTPRILPSLLGVPIEFSLMPNDAALALCCAGHSFLSVRFPLLLVGNDAHII